MAATQLAGVDLPESIAGMSKGQLYDIMSQMKALIEKNQEQARHILVTNPPLTRALFQAQIMLGMVQSAETVPSFPPTSQNSQQSSVQATSTIAAQVGVEEQRSATEAMHPPNKQQQKQTMMPVPSPSIPPSSVQSHPQPSHPPNKQQQKQTMMPVPSHSIPPPSVQSHPQPSHTVQSWQQPMEHVSAEATTISLPQPPQVHTVHPPILSATHQSPTRSQQASHPSGISQMPFQPPLQPQQRPPFIPAFGHQTHSQMGPNGGLLHSGAPQIHHARPMFHSGHQHPVTMRPLFSQGHPTPTHQPTPYQGGSPHMQMEINQVHAVRGSPWITGLRDTTATHFLPGTPQYGGGHIGPGGHLHRPQSLSPDMETALLQQVMSLTPEQIYLLPAEQRNQVIQLQMMLRQ